MMKVITTGENDVVFMIKQQFLILLCPVIF